MKKILFCKNKYLQLIYLLGLGLFCYGGLAYIIWWKQLFPHINEGFFGASSDPMSAIWMLAHWHNAIIQHTGLYHSAFQWAPIGINLTHLLSMPLIGAMSFPLTHRFGPVVAANSILVFTCAASSLTAAFFFRLFTRSILLALLAGFVYGYSSYQVAHLMAHLTLVVTFLWPLILYFIVQQIREKFSAWITIPVFCVLLIMQFLIAEEIYTIFAFFVTIIAILAFIIIREDRRKILNVYFSIVAGYLISVLILFPYILHFTKDHDLSFAKNVFYASIDIFNLFIPTPIDWFGGNASRGITNYFSSNIFEATGYLGLPILTILLLSIKEFWDEKIIKVLILSIMILIFCSFGPLIHFLGKPIFPGPWIFFYKLPFLKLVMPGRFMMFAFLLIPIVVIYWFEHSIASKKVKVLMGMLIILFFIPNPSPKKYQDADTQWYTPIHVPQFIQKKIYKKLIPQNAIILVLPLSSPICQWQVNANMYFRLATGCLDGPDVLTNSPAVLNLKQMEYQNNVLSLKIRKQFSEYIAANHIQLMVVENKWIKKFMPLLSAVSTHSTIIGNYTLYKVR